MRGFIKTVAAVAAVMVAGAASGADRGLIPLADVPADVRKAADKAAPGTVWLPLARSDGDGYLLIGSDAKKRTVDFLSDPTGKKCGVRVSVPLADVPAAVTAAARNGVPKFEPKSAQRIGPATNDLGGYRLIGPGYGGILGGVYVGGDGKKVTPIAE